MYYGLTFSSGNESLQVVMNTAGLKFYARATNGGAFGPWKLVCGGEVSGGGDDVLTADRAEVANKAYQLAAPMTITFAGAVNGEVSFDGSTNVVANLTGNTSGGGGGVSEDRVREMCRQVIIEEIGTDKYPYKLIEQAIIDAINEHFKRDHK